MKKDDGEKVRDLEFSVVGETEAPQELKTILAEKRTQPFKLTFTDAYSYLIAKRAEERGTGARGLNAIIDESTWCAFDEIYKKDNRGIYSEVILTEKTVSDPSNFQLVKK